MEVYAPVCQSVLKGFLSPEDAAELCCPIYPPGPEHHAKMRRSASAIYALLNGDPPDIPLTVMRLRQIWATNPSLQRI
jgi:hypothetical protein